MVLFVSLFLTPGEFSDLFVPVGTGRFEGWEMGPSQTGTRESTATLEKGDLRLCDSGESREDTTPSALSYLGLLVLILYLRRDRRSCLGRFDSSFT